MPNVNELQSEAVKWQKRVGMIQGAGLSTGPIMQLARTDLQRLASGGSPYPEDQIVSMVHSAYTGNVSTPPSQPKADWNPLDITSHALADIGNYALNAIPGVIHTAADIISPHKWDEMFQDIGKYHWGTPSEMAKEVKATPILGDLAPGTFALTASWGDITQHPLNFALDVFAFAAPTGALAAAPFADAAAVGDTAEIGATAAAAGDTRNALTMLKEQHPLGAIAQATGLRDYIDSAIKKLPEPLNEFGWMPIWRNLQMLTRVYTRKYAEGFIKELQNAGIISKNMSNDDAYKLSYEAMHYNGRYAQHTADVSPAQEQASRGDPALLLGRNDPNVDIHAYTVGPYDDPKTPAPVIYFNQQDAINSIPGGTGIDPAQFIREVRVAKHDITHDAQGWHGKDLIPFKDAEGKPLYYNEERVNQLQSIRKVVDTYRSPRAVKALAKESQRAHDLVILPGPHGTSMTYRRDSLPNRAFEKKDKAHDEHNKAKAAHEAAQRDVENALAEHNAVKQEHYAAFGESAADAAKRTPTNPTLGAVATAAQSFFNHLAQVSPIEARSAERLSKAFMGAAGDTKKIPLVRKELSRMIKSMKRDPRLAQELSYAKQLDEYLTNLASRSSSALSKKVDFLNASERERIAASNEVAAKAAADAADKEFNDALAANPPDAQYPLLDERVRSTLQARATSQYLSDVRNAQGGRANLASGVATSLQQLRQAYVLEMQQIKDAVDRGQLAAVKGVGEETLAQVEKDVFNDWAQMSRAGYDPIWLSNVDESHYMRMSFHDIRPLPDRPYISENERSQIFDYSGPGVLDIRAQLSHMGVEYLRQEATNQFLDYLVNRSKVIQKRSDLLHNAMKRYKEERFANASIDEEYVNFDAKRFVGHDLGLQEGDQWMIPRGVKDGFDRLMDGNRLPYPAPLRAARRVWKVTVLTGPRHFVHVAVGSLAMEALAQPEAIFDLLKQPVDLYKWARTGVVPPNIEKEIGKTRLADLGDWRKGNYEERIDEFMDFSDRIWQYHSGTVMGRMIGQRWAGSKTREAIVSGTQKLNNLENTISDMYRGSVLLHEMRHNATNEAAMALVNKIFIDVDNLTPFERSTVRSIFPFWTFTKHILRYVLTYPSDHPLRASILANIALQLEEEQKSGDPGRLKKLFMMGEPNASGQVWTLDFSNANPFRSLGSIFSGAGFFQGLAPELQLGLRKAFGYDPVTGMPTFRPHLTYDAYSGTNKAESEPMSAFDFIGTFIPQADIIDHYMLLTDTMKKLKQSNPEAYTKSLFQALNFPFILAPINIYDIRAKAAAAQYVDASQAVADAMYNGDTSGIRKFAAVPFEGQLYDSNQVANYIDNFHNIFPQFAPKAIMKKPKRRKKQQIL